MPLNNPKIDNRDTQLISLGNTIQLIMDFKLSHFDQKIVESGVELLKQINII